MLLVSARCSLLVLLVTVLGCDSHVVGPGYYGQAGSEGSEGDGAEPGVVDTCASFYADFEPTLGVSFREDLVPILQERCNSSICHGGPHDKAQAQLWLGPDEMTEPTEDELWFVYRSLVDIQSTVAPQLALVRRRDAAQSYFMRKLDDCHEPEGLECVLDPALFGSLCGQRMPVLATQLSVSERDLFRSWIENGAPEN